MVWGSVAENDARCLAEKVSREMRFDERNKLRYAADAAVVLRDANYARFVEERCLATKSKFEPVKAYGNCLFLVLFLCWQLLNPGSTSVADYKDLKKLVCFQSGRNFAYCSIQLAAFIEKNRGYFEPLITHETLSLPSTSTPDKVWACFL